MTYDNPIEFIKLLKSEHRAIISTLCDIDAQQGGASNIQDSANKLNKITDLLFDHLEKEDKKLYPTLLASRHTTDMAKKYSYDMERLSCIAVDFFKRYCLNKEGLKIFVEDFINGYSVFKGLLKVRIQREETELYPAFILLQSGVLESEVINYVKEKETNHQQNKRNIYVTGKNKQYLEALVLGMEIAGFQVSRIHSPNEILLSAQKEENGLVLLDLTESDKETDELVMSLKRPGIQIVGYSTTEPQKLKGIISSNLDAFVEKPAFNIEEFTKKMNQLVSK